MFVTPEKVKLTVRQKMGRLISYFLKGLLIVLPIAVTYGIVKAIILKLDEYFDVGVPAVGAIAVLIGLTVLGFVGSRIVTVSILAFIDEFFTHIPFVKVIYSSVRDFVEAFVGDKKKFTTPVLVEWTPGLFKPGFVTQTDLTSLYLPGMVAVYFPLSYAFSGNVFIVESSRVKPLKGNPTEVMKFIVSGGVINVDQETRQT
jgi:uncharacterized membrane protein